MLNPNYRIKGLTSLQVRVLLNATEKPQAPSTLNKNSIGSGIGYVERLADAGFLSRHPGVYCNSTASYAITPLGKQFAELLERLESVNANH